MTQPNPPQNFPSYAEYGTIAELKNPVFGWSYFENEFGRYVAAAEKAGKAAPFISVWHAKGLHGESNGSFIVHSPAELKELLYYMPRNSMVSIAFYAGVYRDQITAKLELV